MKEDEWMEGDRIQCCRVYSVCPNSSCGAPRLPCPHVWKSVEWLIPLGPGVSILNQWSLTFSQFDRLLLNTPPSALSFFHCSTLFSSVAPWQNWAIVHWQIVNEDTDSSQSQLCRAPDRVDTEPQSHGSDGDRDGADSRCKSECVFGSQLG